MKKIAFAIFALALVLSIAPQAFAAATVNRVDNVVTITAIDADWTWTDTFPGWGPGMRVISIEFIGGAVDDHLVVKNETDAGPTLMDRYIDDVKFSTTKTLFGARVKPMIDFSACTLSVGHKVIIVIGE